MFTLPSHSVIEIAAAESEAELVRIALGLLQHDLANVLDCTVRFVSAPTSQTQLVVGTLGSPLLQRFAFPAPETHPEAYLLSVTTSQLWIAGQDKRGTAYGIMELTRLLGVSPWEWWADAVPAKRRDFTLPESFRRYEYPSVRYRGIFINDEDVGFAPWAVGFEPEAEKLLKARPFPKDPIKVIGPRTYSKVFELLLRLKANLIWPAMHGCSSPFYLVKGNAEAADRYGIYVGATHCEPLNCNANREWNRADRGEYDFANNHHAVIKFWSDRLQEIGHYDNVYTIGMRGVHDSGMNGARTVDECRELLTRVLTEQRHLLEEYCGKSADQIPQIFVPYKEVLGIYRSGLKVPEDVTLMWCNDNYGYVLQLSNEEERKRAGGAGLYYHLSYYGTPYNYLWLSTNHPGQIFRELTRAYREGAQKIWVINVGDIKPTEYQMQLTLDLAWDIHALDQSGPQDHVTQWFSEVFGAQLGPSIADCMMESYRLAWIRKPESLDPEPWWWWRDNVPFTKRVHDCDLTAAQALQQIQDYDALEARVLALAPLIPTALQDAWYELVEYPLRAAAAANRSYLGSGLAREGKLPWEVSQKAHQAILDLTARYNALPRWHNMMGLDSPNWGPFRLYDEKDTWQFKPESHPRYFHEFQGSEALERFTPAYQMGYREKAVILPKGASAEFSLESLSNGEYQARFAIVPTHPVAGNHLRARVTLDGALLGILEFRVLDRTEEWCWNIVRNQSRKTIAFPIATPGRHVLAFTPIDEEILLDQLQVTSLQ